MKSVYLTILIIITGVDSAKAQQVLFDPLADSRGESGYTVKWDPSPGRIVATRDTSQQNLVSARLFEPGGKSIAVYPLKDIPGAHYIDIWAGASSPRGGLVLAAIVGYGPRGSKPDLKSVILTYNESGVLKKFWNVSPYHHHALAVDELGNVFALGDRGDTTNSYPLIIKYSPKGAVVGEYLPTSLFSIGDDVLNPSKYGDYEMFLNGNELSVLIGATRELFLYSTEGHMLARIPLAQSLQKIEAANDGAELQILRLGLQPDKSFVGQARLWPKVKGQPVSIGMLHITADGGSASFEPKPAGQITRLFLGTTREGKMVFRESSGSNSLIRIE